MRGPIMERGLRARDNDRKRRSELGDFEERRKMKG